MDILEFALIGLGLSMDAVAVSMTNGMVYKKLEEKIVMIPLFFGGFQALMPVLGYFGGDMISGVVSGYAGYVVFLILGIIGFKMIKDGIVCHKGVCPVKGRLSYKILVLQALATSIDAFAVGVGLGAAKVDIVSCVLLIGAITAVLTFAAVFIGKKFGDFLGGKAEIFGGIILAIIAVKAILP